LKINVICDRPKYAKGDYSFTGFKELYQWLTSIRSVAKADPSYFLFSLAKSGVYVTATARQGFEIGSDFHDYHLAREVGFETGLLRKRGFGDKINPGRETALRFAEEIDRRITERN